MNQLIRKQIVQKRSNEYVIFPLVDMDVWKTYKEQENSFWTVEEVSLEKDIWDFKMKLNDNERHFIKHTLAFFAASDGIVAKNVDINFIDEVSQRGWMEAQFAYQYQIMMENIHNEAYSKLIETLVGDEKERNALYNAVKNVPSIQQKAEWALRWMGEERKGWYQDVPEEVKSVIDVLIQSYRSDLIGDENEQINEQINDQQSKTLAKWMHQRSPTFAQRLVAFAAVEGIFFSASFCSIYWLKYRGTTDPKNNGSLLPGVCKFNELIARDEGMHQSFACLMYRKEIERDPTQALSVSEIHQIIDDAVKCEKRFATESLPVNLLGMNSEMMCEHIEFMADRLLGQLKCAKLYNAREPFSWYDLVSMNQKTNFFEERPTEYAKSGSGHLLESSAQSSNISFDNEF